MRKNFFMNIPADQYHLITWQEDQDRGTTAECGPLDHDQATVFWAALTEKGIVNKFLNSGSKEQIEALITLQAKTDCPFTLGALLSN